MIEFAKSIALGIVFLIGVGGLLYILGIVWERLYQRMKWPAKVWLFIRKHPKELGALIRKLEREDAEKDRKGC